MSNWFADAGIDINDVSENPYAALGNSHWTLYVTEAREPQVSKTGLFGMYCKFQIVEEQWQDVREFGRWIQLPTPKQVQEDHGTTFDPANNRRDAETVAFLVKWLKALGFGMDEIASGQATHQNILNRAFLAQLRATENDEGYYEIKWRNPKPLETSAEENAAPAATANNVADVEAALKSDIDNA
jgi:hypothetical protein